MQGQASVGHYKRLNTIYLLGSTKYSPSHWDFIYVVKLLNVLFVDQIFQYVRRNLHHS